MADEIRIERAGIASRQATVLESMRRAKPGWDGHSAAKPVGSTIDMAKDLVHLLVSTSLPMPSATMSPSGNAGLVVSQAGLYFDLEVMPDGCVEWILLLPGGRDLEVREPFDGVSMPRHLAAALATLPAGLDKAAEPEPEPKKVSWLAAPSVRV